MRRSSEPVSTQTSYGLSVANVSRPSRCHAASTFWTRSQRAQRARCSAPRSPRCSRADMKIAVLGAGAIGGFIGASLARGGVECHLIARGANLETLRRDGATVLHDDGSWTIPVSATDDPREIGTVDIVVLGLKAHSYTTAGPL